MNEPLLGGPVGLAMNQEIMQDHNILVQQDRHLELDIQNGDEVRRRGDNSAVQRSSLRNSIGSLVRDSLRLSANQQNRLDVRNSLINQISEAINESIMINALFFIVSVNKIIAYLVLNNDTNGEKCLTGQLCVWLKLMFIHDILQSIHLILLLIVIFIKRQRGIASRWRNLDVLELDFQALSEEMNQIQSSYNGFFITDAIIKRNWIISILKDSTRLFYIIIFLQGNILIFYNEEQYIALYPNHFYLALVFVIMGYFYMGIPLFFFASICLCMPFMLVMYLVFRSRRAPPHKGLDDAVIQNLSIKYLKDIERRSEDDTLECCICLVEYEENEEIIILPCNKYHHFHATCIIQWIKINGICPICKRELKDLILQMDDLSQSQQPNPQQPNSYQTINDGVSQNNAPNNQLPSR